VVLVRVVLSWPRQSMVVASFLDALSRAARLRDTSFWRRGVMYIGMFNTSARRPFPEVVRGPDPMTLRPPMVLASVHMGQVEAVGALLERLPGQVLVFADRELPIGRGFTSVCVAGNEWQRAAVTRRAIQTLRSGGFVFLAVDGRIGNARVETTLSGERVSWSRGGFDLARITSSPMLPVMTRWRGRKVEIVTGELICPSDASTMASSLARWLEEYLA
jgi:lauroyl/myristoyl acyltransferase